MSSNLNVFVFGPDSLRAKAFNTNEDYMMFTIPADPAFPSDDVDTCTLLFDVPGMNTERRSALVMDAQVVVFVLSSWDAAIEEAASWYASRITQPFLLWQISATTALPKNILESHPMYCGAYSGVPADRPQILQMVRNCAKYPLQSLWDVKENSFTANGWRSLRRAFWLLDVDLDGVLNDTEIYFWHNKLFGATNDTDVATLKSFLQKQQQQQQAAKQQSESFITEQGAVTPTGFLAVCQAMIFDKKQLKLWRMLRSFGCGANALPYTQQEIADLELPDHTCTYELSPFGEAFFTSLVSERRFPTPKDMWTFVPGCGAPWPGGMQEKDLEPKHFMLRWRNEAVTNYRTVCMYARWWNFSEPLSVLFIPKRKRQFVSSKEKQSGSNVIPNVIRVLVAGAPKCGKTSLVKYITNGVVVSPDDEEGQEDSSVTTPASSTIEYVTPAVKGGNCITIVDCADEDVVECVRNDLYMSTIDVVLLIFDGSDPFGFSYVAKVHDMIEEMKYKKLPVVITLSKMDLGVVDQEDGESPDIYCTDHRLLWPPLITTVVDPKMLPTSMLSRNEAGKILELVSELAEHPELAKVDYSSRDGGVAGFGNSTQRRDGVKAVNWLLAAAAGLIVVAAVGYIVFSRRKTSHTVGRVILQTKQTRKQ
eukprot:PhF_6_TR7349/c0_g1_i1/m.11046/K07870/RHOT1, ARHT1; mitochondrial Rho GTPase 1